MSEDSVIENEELTEPIKLSASFYGSTLTATVQPDFPLCEADYLRLTKSGSSLKDWATGIFLASIGGTLIVIGKFVALVFDDSTPTVETWEWCAVVIGLILALALFGLSFVWPGDKARTLSNMKKHFSSNPRQHHVMKSRK